MVEKSTEELMKLVENMYALSTPQFRGTNEEMIGAVNFWVGLISQLRGLFMLVTNYDNKTAILDSIERELAVMKAELQNLSAKPVSDGSIAMVAPVAVPAPAAAAPEVDLSVREEIERAQRNAGIQPRTGGLADALKKYQQ